MTVHDEIFEARLKRVLRDGAARIPVGHSIPALPTWSPMVHSASKQRKRFVRRRITGAGLVVGLAVAGTAVATATSVPPRPSLAPGTKATPAPAAITEAVTSILPAGSAITSSQHVQTGRTDYDQVTATAGDGSQLTYTVYGNFSAAELDGSALPRSYVSGGTVWVGSDSPTGRSVYFLSSSSVGVYVRSDSAAGHAASLSDVSSDAIRLAAALPRP